MALLAEDIRSIINTVIKKEPSLEVVHDDPLDGDRHFYHYQFSQSHINYTLTIEPIRGYYSIGLRLSTEERQEPFTEIVLDCDTIELNQDEYETKAMHLVFPARRLGISHTRFARHWLRISNSPEGYNIGSYFIAEYPE